MKPFEYGDEEIGSREIGFAVSSTIIGIGALSMPRDIADSNFIFGRLDYFTFGWIDMCGFRLVCNEGSYFIPKTKLCSIYKCAFDETCCVHN